MRQAPTRPVRASTAMRNVPVAGVGSLRNVTAVLVHNVNRTLIGIDHKRRWETERK